MFRARFIASLLVPVAGLLFACSSSSKSNAAADAAAAPDGDVGCMQAAGDAYAPGMQKLGDAGQYTFELLSSSPAPPALNDNTFVVQVKDGTGQPLAGALSVALDMPEHGHSSPTQPDIAFDPAAGTFTLQPMRLFMVGLWRFTFRFQPAKGSVADAESAVFNFCVQ